jgi:hypothetical protein
MANYLNIKETNKGLEIKATKEGKEYIREQFKSHPEDLNCGYQGNYNMLWADLLEYYSCNGSYSIITPESIGALTDAPIIASEANYNDDGNIELPEDAKIWWLSDYMVLDEMMLLRKGKTVIFELAS